MNTDLHIPQEQLKELLQIGEIDAGNSRLSDVSKQYQEKNKLTLIIGIGGSGIACIRKILHLADNKLTSNYKHFVKFIAVDSSEEDLRKLNNMGVTTITEQDRIQHNSASIRNAIQNLFQTSWVGYQYTPIDIIILTSVAGQTGSRTFIDLAVQAKSTFPNQSLVKVYGYIMVPNTKSLAPSNMARQIMYQNSFEALKKLAAPDQPFDIPILVSGYSEEAVTTIGETILNLLIIEDYRFGTDSFFSNLQSFQNYVMSNDVESYYKNYHYATYPEDSLMSYSISYSHATLPDKLIISKIISEVCKKLYSESISRSDFEHAIRYLFKLNDTTALTRQTIFDKILSTIKSNIRLQENSIDLTYDDISNGNIKEYINGYHIEETAAQAVEKIIQVLQNEYQEIVLRAQILMKQYGPRLLEYLYFSADSISPNSIHEIPFNIDISIRTLFNETLFGLEALTQQKAKWPDPLPSASFFKKLFSHNKVSDWKADADHAAYQHILSLISKHILTYIQNNEFQEKIEQFICSSIRFADVLETMNSFYTWAGKYYDSDNSSFFRANSIEPCGINLCSDEKAYNWVCKKIDQVVNRININTAKEFLIDSFLSDPTAWTSNQIGETRKTFDDIMARICHIGKYASTDTDLSITISDYFNTALYDLNSDQAISFIKKIIHNLLIKAEPLINKNFSASNCINRSILIPTQLIRSRYGRLIETALQEELHHSGTIIDSPYIDEIICYQISIVNALSELKYYSVLNPETPVVLPHPDKVPKVQPAGTASSKELPYVSLFADSLLYGIISSNENDDVYTISINQQEYPIPLTAYTSSHNIGLTKIEKHLLSDELKLVIVYHRFKELIDTGSITVASIKEKNNSLIETLSAYELDELIDRNINKAEKEIIIYNDIIAGAPNPVTQLLAKYHMPDDDYEEAQSVVMLYDALQNAINNI